MEKPACHKCKFWVPIQSETSAGRLSGDGSCVRHPPAWVLFPNDRGAEVKCAFPQVGGEYWCGDFVQKIILS